MNIGVAYENGRIAKNLGDCREVLIIPLRAGNRSASALPRLPARPRPT
ncbi:MAG: hypothetical protein ACLT2F_08435 [Butyricicoccus sp.]